MILVLFTTLKKYNIIIIKPLRPGTLAGLADGSPEGTEGRWAPCDAVYTALPQRGRPSRALGHWHQDILAEDDFLFFFENDNPQICLWPGSATVTPTPLGSTRSDIPE